MSWRRRLQPGVLSVRPRLPPGTRSRPLSGDTPRARHWSSAGVGAGPKPLTAVVAGRIGPSEVGCSRVDGRGEACRWLSMCLRTQLTSFLGFSLALNTFRINCKVAVRKSSKDFDL